MWQLQYRFRNCCIKSLQSLVDLQRSSFGKTFMNKEPFLVSILCRLGENSALRAYYYPFMQITQWHQLGTKQLQRPREEERERLCLAQASPSLSMHVLFMGLFLPAVSVFFLCRCSGLRLCRDLIVGNIIACLFFPRVMLVSLKTQWLKRDNGIHCSKLGIVNKLFLL